MGQESKYFIFWRTKDWEPEIANTWFEIGERCLDENEVPELVVHLFRETGSFKWQSETTVMTPGDLYSLQSEAEAEERQRTPSYG